MSDAKVHEPRPHAAPVPSREAVVKKDKVVNWKEYSLHCATEKQLRQSVNDQLSRLLAECSLEELLAELHRRGCPHEQVEQLRGQWPEGTF